MERILISIKKPSIDERFAEIRLESLGGYAIDATSDIFRELYLSLEDNSFLKIQTESNGLANGTYFIFSSFEKPFAIIWTGQYDTINQLITAFLGRDA